MFWTVREPSAWLLVHYPDVFLWFFEHYPVFWALPAVAGLAAHLSRDPEPA